MSRSKIPARYNLMYRKTSKTFVFIKSWKIHPTIDQIKEAIDHSERTGEFTLIEYRVGYTTEDTSL